MSLAKWKEREREQRQNDIIDAARKLLIDRDFDEVSMDEIAREVGLGKSTLYLYFKNKESLYFAIVLRGIRIWDKMNSSEEFKEVRELFKEIMSVGIDSIQKGIDDGEIRPEVDPVETAILLSVIFNGKVNMGDWAKEMLENRGIGEEKFTRDIGDLFLHMLMK